MKPSIIINLSFLILFGCQSNTTNNREFTATETQLILSGNHFIIGDKSVLSLNNVNSLIVKECFGESCAGGDRYEFDSLGRKSFFSPSFNSSYSEYKYKNDNLSQVIHFSEPDSSDIRITKYMYTKDSITKLSNAYEYDSLVYESKTTSLIKKEVIQIRKLKNQIIEQLIDETLYFPCGQKFQGPHFVSYNYYENGLINDFVVINSLKDTIKRFRYEYEI